MTELKIEEVMRTFSVSITDDGVVHLHFNYRGQDHGAQVVISLKPADAADLAQQIADILKARTEQEGTTTIITEDKP